jgi:hypothetical protein
MDECEVFSSARKPQYLKQRQVVTTVSECVQQKLSTASGYRAEIRRGCAIPVDQIPRIAIVALSGTVQIRRHSLRNLRHLSESAKSSRSWFPASGNALISTTVPVALEWM